MPAPSTTAESWWSGIAQVTSRAGPIVLSMMAVTLMEVLDTAMVSRLSDAAVAAVGSAHIWAFIMGTVPFGIVTCVGTFASQAIGRGETRISTSYAWQELHLGTIAGIGLAVICWPLAERLFGLMQHPAEVTQLEVQYFRIRLLGMVPTIWQAALTALFISIARPRVPMNIAFVANLINAVLNYGLIYGRLGLPALGVAGAAWGTVAAQWIQASLLLAVMLSPGVRKSHESHRTWRWQSRQLSELIRIGVPNGLFFLMDVATWGIFVSFVVGRFGEVQLAANNIALTCMKLSFMPALAVNQAIGPIVGELIGRSDFRLARRRAWTAVGLSVLYMGVMGIAMAIGGRWVIRTAFGGSPEVVSVGHQLLILAAIFQIFDAISIVVSGALRGAGDTRFMMWLTAIAAYPIFLPLAYLFSVHWNGQAPGAWLAAALYIAGLAVVMSLRFHAGHWERINIFETSKTPSD